MVVVNFILGTTEPFIYWTGWWVGLRHVLGLVEKTKTPTENVIMAPRSSTPWHSQWRFLCQVSDQGSRLHLLGKQMRLSIINVQLWLWATVWFVCWVLNFTFRCPYLHSCKIPYSIRHLNVFHFRMLVHVRSPVRVLLSLSLSLFCLRRPENRIRWWTGGYFMGKSYIFSDSLQYL